MEVAMFRNMIQSHRFSALPTLLILCAPYAGQVVAQPPAVKPAGAAAEEKPAGAKLTTAQKIALARSAGPAEISKNATIMDMTDMRDMKHLKQL